MKSRILDCYFTIQMPDCKRKKTRVQHCTCNYPILSRCTLCFAFKVLFFVSSIRWHECVVCAINKINCIVHRIKSLRRRKEMKKKSFQVFQNNLIFSLFHVYDGLLSQGQWTFRLSRTLLPLGRLIFISGKRRTNGRNGKSNSESDENNNSEKKWKVENAERL